MDVRFCFCSSSRGMDSGSQAHILHYVLFYSVLFYIHRAVHGPLLRLCHEPRMLLRILNHVHLRLILKREKLFVETQREMKRLRETGRGRVGDRYDPFGKGCYNPNSTEQSGSEGSCGTGGCLPFWPTPEARQDSVGERLQ